MPLETIAEIELDTSQPFLSVVNAKQYDTARKVKAHLYFSGVKWPVPEGNLYALVSYKRTDRIGGMYDLTSDGEIAVTVSSEDRSIIYISLDKSMMGSPGEIHVEIVFFEGNTDARLSGFSFLVEVEEAAIQEADLAATPYFSLLSQQIGEILRLIDEGGLVSTVDSTLSTSSSNPVQNRILTEEINQIKQRLDNLE